VQASGHEPVKKRKRTLTVACVRVGMRVYYKFSPHQPCAQAFGHRPVKKMNGQLTLAFVVGLKVPCAPEQIEADKSLWCCDS